MKPVTILSAFGNQQVNAIIQSRLPEHYTVEELRPLTITALYERVSNPYDVLIFRDSAIEVKLNPVSLIKKIKEENPEVKIIFILENEYEHFVEEYIKRETTVSFLRSSKIDAMVKLIQELTKVEEEIEDDYDDEDDMVFNLETLEEKIINLTDDEVEGEDIETEEDVNLASIETAILTQVESDEPLLDKEENLEDMAVPKVEKLSAKEKVNANTMAEKAKMKPQFGLHSEIKHTFMDMYKAFASNPQNMYTFLNTHSLETQAALQMANLLVSEKDIVYIEFDKANFDFIDSFAHPRVTTIKVDEPLCIDTILKHYQRYTERGKEKYICIINAPYNDSLLLLSMFGEVILEFTQNRYIIDRFAGKTTQMNASIHYLVSYYEEKLYSLKEIEGILQQDVYCLTNTRVKEYQSRKNKELMQL